MGSLVVALSLRERKRKRRKRSRRDVDDEKGKETRVNGGRKGLCSDPPPPPPPPPTEWSFCFRGRGRVGNKFRDEWFVLRISMEDIIKKEVFRRRQYDTKYPLGGDIAFYHGRRHEGEGDGEVLQTLAPILVREEEDNFCSTPPISWAALGSTIYCLGGRCLQLGNGGRDYLALSSQVRCFDAHRPWEGWRNACPLINPRSDAKVVALDGKLYVFGGLGGGGGGGDWAEVFDPKGCDGRGLWAALPSPPSSLSLESDCLFAGKKKKKKKMMILVGTKSSSYYRHGFEIEFEFDVSSNCWVRLKHPLHIPIYPRGSRLNSRAFSRPVLVDNTLYCLQQEIIAYDLNEKKLFHHGSIIDSLIDDKLCCNCEDGFDFVPSLLHLAGRFFCLLWVIPTEHPSMSTPPSSTLHCTVLELSKSSPEKYPSLTASVLYCGSYLIDHELNFLDALPLL